jgi:hypothetical protein
MIPFKYAGLDLEIPFDPDRSITRDLPSFLSEDDPRSASEQLATNCRRGSGWFPLEGWSVPPSRMAMVFPGDPPYSCVAVAKLRDEALHLFMPGSWLAIFQPDGSFEVAHADLDDVTEPLIAAA